MIIFTHIIVYVTTIIAISINIIISYIIIIVVDIIIVIVCIKNNSFCSSDIAMVLLHYC